MSTAKLTADLARFMGDCREPLVLQRTRCVLTLSTFTHESLLITWATAEAVVVQTVIPRGERPEVFRGHLLYRGTSHAFVNADEQVLVEAWLAGHYGDAE